MFASCQVSGYLGDAQLEEAVTGCDIVVIPAGVPRKPGMTRDDLFNINAGIVRTLVTAVAKRSPKGVFLFLDSFVKHRD